MKPKESEDKEPKKGEKKERIDCTVVVKPLPPLRLVTGKDY